MKFSNLAILLIFSVFCFGHPTKYGQKLIDSGKLDIDSEESDGDDEGDDSLKKPKVSSSILA